MGLFLIIGVVQPPPLPSPPPPPPLSIAPPLPPRPPGFMPTEMSRRLEDLEPSSGDSIASTLYVVGDDASRWSWVLCE